MSSTAIRTEDTRAASDSPATPAVVVENVSKTFRIPHQQVFTLKERALHPFRQIDYDELHAVRDLSIEIAEGEFFGIVGRNGSGKSTLLKCIAGIYGADRGFISVRGRLSPFIELGVGFNLDLNARDNVVINAIMLGLSRKEATRRFDRIVEFAELEDFMDLRLKNYSSGMLVRLGFATAIQVEAEVLLVDEVLAVGDAAFQQKCFEEFVRLKRERKTIVFVSHDMYSIERFCDRAMLMEHGLMTKIGEPRAIGRAYYELNFGELAHEAPPESGSQTGEGAKIIEAWFENQSGEHVLSESQEEPLRLCFETVFGEDVEEPVFAVTLRTELGHTIFVVRSDQHGGTVGSFKAGQAVIARFQIPSWLTAARYVITPSVAKAGTGEDTLALVEDMASIMIHGNCSGGILEVPVEVTLERV